MVAAPIENLIGDRLQLSLNAPPTEAASMAGLRYVTDDMAGISRKRWGRGFVYRDADGNKIKDKQQLERIKALTIPPALEEVWICPTANGHLQATGRDAKGRKQYIYHSEWRKWRSQAKYNRMLLFGAYLPTIRQKTAEDLKLPGLPKTRVLATVVQLLETTLIRVGNSQYARKNRSFGLTTMRDRHVTIKGSQVKFHFRGKSGVQHEVELGDRRLAKIVKKCRDIPGYQLFQYYDENGDRQSVDSADVNQYLQTLTGQEFTAKDFRTWAGTLLVALALDELGEFDSNTQAKKHITQAVKHAASQLGNRPATCRKYYVHPAIIQAYQQNKLLPILAQAETNILQEIEDLHPEEKAVLYIIREHISTVGA